ncbi:hypothetical protein V5O48_004315 [Marasmius crinis-equi]|uniref:Isochorismatase-like domain-containing protein n=1 Tax=Marasmius crinis-equi TaxID=585013 RepID=A0ABR3FQS6_9AGAR
MRVFFALLIASIIGALQGVFGYKYDRLEKNNSVVVLVDQQIGVHEMVRDFEPVEFKNKVLAHAAIAKLFDIPIVITTTTDDGPNGPIIKEISDMYPDTPVIRRPGEVNAWDNEEFREAVRATGKTQIILAGVITDVCTTFLALSFVDEGYTVYANAEASGTYSSRMAEYANDRMRAAGVQVVPTIAIVMELMRDWRATPGAAELAPFIDEYLPFYGIIARNFNYAKNGTQV